MIKDHFQKYIGSLNQLRSEHFKVSEYLAKGKYRMRQKFFGKGKKHYDFDLNSQEFFHQYVDDIIFEQPEIQQIFYNKLANSLDHPIRFNNKKVDKTNTKSQIRKNPSEVRATLQKHFKVRINDLNFRKYKISLRLHNISEELAEDNDNYEFLLKIFNSRNQLIDKEIQQCLNRQNRLACEDYFEESYIMGGKPVPINENGQPIYKYLDEEDCWFSNISREDIQVYARSTLYSEQVLDEKYWPIYYQTKALIMAKGVQILEETDKHFVKQYNQQKDALVTKGKELIGLFEKDLQDISPGNLQEKQNIHSFIYEILGVTNNCLLYLPVLPITKMDLTEGYTKATSYFFEGLVNPREKTLSYKQIINLGPKLSNFCSILFKYQNQQILEGQKQIKLGLQDDVDMKKQLVTMLEELWVRKHIKINYERFEYRLYLKHRDYSLDNYSRKLEKYLLNRVQNGYQEDPALLELLRQAKTTSYSNFRKAMKRRSQKNINRLQKKYYDMQLIQKYAGKTDEQINMQKLNELYRVKITDLSFLSAKNLKQSTEQFINIILKNYIYRNPVELQILETLKMIRIRQLRTKVMNILNAIRCYQRNIQLDLRVINNCDFKFQMDDQLLINSNKQVIEKLEKDIKDNETVITKMSKQQVYPTKQNQDFLMKNTTVEKKILYKKDIVMRKQYGEKIPHFLVADGKRRKNNIIYDTVMDDLSLIEDRLIDTGTHYINYYERIVKMKDLGEIVDRSAVLEELYELQLEYQFQKINLIENYYFIYQNTTDPLNAEKLIKIMTELIYKKPQFDLSGHTYRTSYRLQIKQLQTQNKIVESMINLIKNSQKNCNKNFHKLFAKMQNIPLTLWGYIYGDMEVKVKSYNKLQRMNSISSKISRNSDPLNPNNLKQLRDQIKQQFGQDSQDEEEFKIEEYDQYMLRKNMDDIFEDIVGGDQKNQNNQKQKDTGTNVTALGLQNLVLNPRFEGGPYPMLNYLPEIPLTSKGQQKMLNFMEFLCWIVNIHHLIEQLTQESRKNYGNYKKNYELCIKNKICEKILTIVHNIDLEPMNVEKFHEFQTDDPYYETVIKSLANYEEIMTPILDPPTTLQYSLPSTHQRHQTQLPPYSSLQYFDLSTLKDLIKLKKPINIAQYRQLNLGINFIEFLRLRNKINHTQLQREFLIRSYFELGRKSEIILQKFTHCYTRTGNVDAFLASSEIRIMDPFFLKYPVYNQSIDILRNLYSIELSDLKLFRQFINYCKYRTQSNIRIMSQIDNVIQSSTIPNIHYIFNFDELLLSKDPKTVRILKKRMQSQVAFQGSETLKINNYLKFKAIFRTTFDARLKQIKQQNFEGTIEKLFLTSDKPANVNFGKTCTNILQEKIKSLLILQLAANYNKQLLHNAENMETFNRIYFDIRALSKFSKSVPYLSQIIYIPTNHQQVLNKAFYDQKALKNIRKKLEPEKSQNYIQIYGIEELLEEWKQFLMSLHCTYLENHDKPDIEALCGKWLPPSEKDDLFKWLFQIPQNNVKGLQKQAIRHFLKIGEPYTGKTNLIEYSLEERIVPTRNKYLDILHKYDTILEYLQVSLTAISLRLEDDLFDTFHQCIDDQVDFESRYPMADETIIEEKKNTDFNDQSSILAPCFIYENKKSELEQKLKQKISSRGYTLNKQHWAVLDQILDFIITRVQGYGVLRQYVLPIKDQLTILIRSLNEEKKLKKNKDSDSFLSFLSIKTQNMYKLLWIAIWETQTLQYNKEIDEQVLDLSDSLLDNAKSIENLTASYCSNLFNCITNDISCHAEETLQEKVRFYDGIVCKNDEYLTTNIKPIFSFLPVNVGQFLEDLLLDMQGVPIQNYRNITHNQDNFNALKVRFRKLKNENRDRISGNLRYFYDRGNRYLNSRVKKQVNPTCEQYSQSQQHKSNYFNFLVSTKVYMLALSYFKLSVNQSIQQSQSISDTPHYLFSWAKFHEVSGSVIEQIDYLSYTVYDNLEAYKDSNKIQFSKSELQVLGKNQGSSSNQYNKLLRDIILNKLLFEEFKSYIIEVASKKLKNQKLPKQEPKKIQNQSLIPRVHLIASYSSPLIVERKTYISQQYKLAFVQAFINRFRNKVSRVDLLSAGYGFVITVPDLEDCVNFMNKLLFTFTQKQFRRRSDTFSQYYEILVEGIKSRNKIIIQQRAVIQHLSEKAQNILQAEYLAKVTKLLQQKTLLQQKMQLTEQASNGLQHRIRKAIELEYDRRVSELQKENKQLHEKFDKFKELLVRLFKDTTKNNFLQILNDFRTKVGNTLDRKIQLRESFSQMQKILDNPKQYQLMKVDEQRNQQQQERQTEGETEYSQKDIQKCKIGQDIIHDPYYVTKLINKMRLFNVFKMGCKRIKHERQKTNKHKELIELHQIQDKYIVQTERERIMREQLIKAHEELSKKNIELEKTKYQNDGLENEKAKMKILINSKDRKIEMKQREYEELKRQIQVLKQQKYSKLPYTGELAENTSHQQQLPKISNVRHKKKSVKKVDPKAFLTNLQLESSITPNASLYEKFELSNKDSTWRQKCEQLYLENKRLMQDLQKMRDASTPQQKIIYSRDSNSLNLRNRRPADLSSSQRDRGGQNKKKFGNLSFKFNSVKQ